MQAVNIEEKNGLGVNQSTSGKNDVYNISEKQTKISFYLKANTKNVEKELCLDEILKCIKSDPLSQGIVKILRDTCKAELDEKKRKKIATELKMKLPAFGASLFLPPIRKKENFLQADAMVFDLDGFKDIGIMESVKNELAKEAYAVFTSPSGYGLKIVYLLSETIKDAEVFESTYKHKNNEYRSRYENICEVDNTFDVARLCFVSDDPNIIINPEAPALKVIAPSSIESIMAGAVVDSPLPGNQPAPIAKAKKVSAKVAKASPAVITPATGDDRNISRYSELLAKLDPNSNYKSWLDAGIVGKNISDTCYDAWNDWSKQSEKYQPGECSEKWKSFTMEMTPADAIAWLEKMTGEKHWWRVFKIETKTSEYDDLYIDEIEKEKFLASHGIAKTYRDSAESIYIKRDGCIIEEVSRERIADILYSDLKTNPVAYNLAIKKYKEQISGEQTLRSTVSLKEYMMHWDTKDACFLYFADKVLKIEKDKYSTIDYGSWSGDEVIWRDTLLKQKADVIEEKSVFDQFVRNAVGDKNVESIMSCIGYMLHRFKVRSNAKLICFCDGDADVDGGKNKGGRGKGIVSNQLLGSYRKQKGFDGKKFDPSDNFAWQGLTESHSIIYIEDLRPNFIFEKLFNLITSGLDINNKNKSSFYIVFEKLAKLIVDSNFVVGHDDDSTNRRKIDVPFQKYYSKEFTPADEFGHTFFTDWDDAEWARCNWFVVRCIQLFLQKGLIEADTSSLTKKRIEKEVGPMYEWICTNLVFLRNENTLKVIQGKYISDEGLSDKEKIDGRKTTKALRAYAEKHGMTFEVRTVRELASSVKKFRLYYSEAQEKQRDESVEDAMEKYSEELTQLESEYHGEAPF